MSNCMFKKLNEAAELYCKLNFSQCTSWPTFYVGQMKNLHSEIKNARGIPLYCRGKFRKVFFLLLFLPSTRWPWKISDLKVSWKNLCKKCNIILLQTFPLKIPIDMLLLKLKNENIERICYLLDSGQCDTRLQVTCDLSPPPPSLPLLSDQLTAFWLVPCIVKYIRRIWDRIGTTFGGLPGLVCRKSA